MNIKNQVKTKNNKEKNMKIKNLAILAGAIIATGFAVQQTQANAIVGDITFDGGVHLNTGSVNTATKVTSWVTPVILSADGDFTPFVTVGTVGDAVSIVQPWIFASGAIPDFWSVDGFTFNLTSSAVVFQGYGGLYVDGTGVISGNDYSATPGTWTFTASNPGAGSPPVFSFQAANGFVPDGGLTVALLGGALAAMTLIRRRVAS
jgi:hypothetical protein